LKDSRRLRLCTD